MPEQQETNVTLVIRDGEETSVTKHNSLVVLGRNVSEIRVVIENGLVTEVIGIDRSGSDERYVIVPAIVHDYDTEGTYDGLAEDEFGNPIIKYAVE